MKAIVLTKYGSADVLELQDVAKPAPKDNEVLVKVHATAVNDWDRCFMRGKPWAYRLFFGLRRPKVRVLGVEVAGTVEAVGDNATEFKTGDAVYGDISEYPTRAWPTSTPSTKRANSNGPSTVLTP